EAEYRDFHNLAPSRRNPSVALVMDRLSVCAAHHAVRRHRHRRVALRAVRTRMLRPAGSRAALAAIVRKELLARANELASASYLLRQLAETGHGLVHGCVFGCILFQELQQGP